MVSSKLHELGQLTLVPICLILLCLIDALMLVYLSKHRPLILLLYSFMLMVKIRDGNIDAVLPM